jgi:phospholipid transport system substrate-binding protein
MDDHELTLTDLLADPMVLAVMAADQVDPAALTAALSGLARRLEFARPAAGATLFPAHEAEAPFANSLRLVKTNAYRLDATKRVDNNDWHKEEDRVVRKPIVSKTPVWKVMALGAGIGLAMLSYPVHAAPVSGGDTVQGLYEALLSTMKNGRTLGQSGRFTQLEPVIRRTFDIPSMARLSVGPSWATLTDAQRQQVTESFGRYISAIYADRFDSYAGQKLQVIGEQPAVAGIMVRSQIVKANGEPVSVDYMMRRDGDSWLISDIYLDGAISEVATRRSEFAAILKSQGIDGLIAALNRKADILTATTAQAS